MWTRDGEGAPELDLSQDRRQECLLRAYGRAPLAFAFAETQGAMLAFEIVSSNGRSRAADGLRSEETWRPRRRRGRWRGIDAQD